MISNNKKFKKEKGKNKVILMNKMCVGSYNINNIGHEIINYFKPDKQQETNVDIDCTYIYINPYGGMSTYYDNKDIDTIILTSAIVDKRVEILAILKNPIKIHSGGDKGTETIHTNEQKPYLNLKYGGVELENIFKDNKDNDKAIYVTFAVKDENMFKPKDNHRIFISDNEADKDSETVLKLKTKKLAKKSLKEYFEDDENKKEGNEYKRIKQFIQNAENNGYLEKFETFPVKLKEYKYRKINILEIMSKVNEEQTYTNLLAYWFSRGDLFNKFITKYFNKADDKNYLVEKEKVVGKNRADIIAIGENNVVVIENKILSGLNSIDKDKESKKTAQLGKMLKYIIEGDKKEADKELYENKDVYGIIFVPKYNKERIEKELEDYESYEINQKERYYKIITYDELLKFFKEQMMEKDGKIIIINKDIENDLYSDYYPEFIKCLENQNYKTINERNKAEIERKFMYAIKKYKAKGQ